MGWVILAVILAGVVLACYSSVVAGKRADEATEKAVHRWKLAEMEKEKTIHGLRKAWLEYSGESWQGTFEELKLHIRNLKERLDD